MNSRTVVFVEPTNDATLITLLKAQNNFADALRRVSFTFTVPTGTDWLKPDAVMAQGLALRNALLQHPAISQALQQLLLAATDQIGPIYFQLVAQDAEQLYWETLYDDASQRFLGLDRRWPIGRIADSVTAQSMRPFYEFDGRLRIMAFLSALGAAAQPEWDGLRQAVVKTRADGLPIDLWLYVGEEELHDAIQAEIAGGGLPDTKVHQLDDSRASIEDAINQVQPHILHFFCHGTSDHNVRRLELASGLDWMNGETSSSLALPIEDLAALPAMQQVWLVLLNCCEGSKPTDNLHSMAHQLVGQGIPAAIGMLEPIAASDAHIFCSGLYQALLQEVKSALDGATPKQPVIIEWVSTMRTARLNLAGPDPKSHREWALPVLYVRPEYFQVVRSGGATPAPAGGVASLQAMMARLMEVAEFLRSLPPDAPAALRTRALALLADVPADLKPDLNGNFTSNTGAT